MALLGLESVEELEMALDSLEGIAPDGGELEPEPDNLAREARVREAYFKWCTLWNKNPDESRFRSFSNNFLLMEQYAKESSKEMTLNQYADFTKQEYEVFLRSGATAKPSSSSPSSSSSPVDAVVVSPVVSASVPSPSVPAPSIPAPAIVTPSISSVDGSVSEKTGLGKILELAAMKIENSLQEIDEKTATSEEREARSKAVADAQAKADLEASAARAKRAAEVLARAQEDVVRRKEIEEQRVARERVLAKEAEKIKTQAEASAIASARAQTEKEVARSAQRAAFDAQAAKEAREKARAWEEQQRQLRQLSSKAVPATKKPALNFFSPKPAVSIAKKTVSAPMVSPVVARPVTPKPAPSSLKLPSFSFFSPSPAPAIKKKVVVAQKPAPSPPSPASTSNKPAASNPFSFFPASNAPAPKAKSQPALTPVVVAPVKKAAEKSPSFSFFAPKPAVAIKKLTPVVVPAPAPAKPSPAFSFFGTGTPKKDVKVPARAGSISILPSKQKESKDIKVPVRAGTINVLKATGVNTKDMAKPTSQSFSLFGSTVPKPIPVSTPAPVSRSPSISLFGGLPRKADEKKADIKVPNRSGTISVKSSPKVEAKPAFSFFGGMSQSSSGTKSVAPASTKSTAPSGVPTLTQWRQGPDGSISGKVSNSKNYRNGTLITTSPVRKGAKAGSVVKTGSGSQYFLS